MIAVAPETSRLRPYVGTMREAVCEAVRGAFDLPRSSDVSLERTGDSVRFRDGRFEIHLGGVSPEARAADGSLTVQVHGPSEIREAVRSALASEPGRSERLGKLAEAIDRWWPFSRTTDEEFRSISSAPEGRYGSLRLGTACNQDCWFCWQDRQGPVPPVERFEGWIDELAALGVGSLEITGGEPTVREYLPALVERAAHGHGMSVSVQTNAVRLAHPAYARRLADAGLRAVLVSLHAADPALSDRMTRAPGTHVRTVRGMIEALGRGLLVAVNCVVERENAALLEEHAEFVVERLSTAHPGNGIARVTYSHPQDYFEPGAWSDHQVPFDVVRPSLSRAVARLREAGIPVDVGGPCGFPLCALEPSLLREAVSLVDRAIFTPEEVVHRHYASVCAECVLRPRCFGLRREYLDRFGEQGLNPQR